MNSSTCMATRLLLGPAVAMLMSCDDARTNRGGDDDDDGQVTTSTATSTTTSTATGTGTGGCSSSEFEALAVTICQTQNPPAPAEGETGAPCDDSTACDSDYCLEPYGSTAYCSLLCPVGDECPVGFHCDDTGTADGNACYEAVCIYGGVDAADCVGNLLGELDAACTSGCELSRVEQWITCVAGAGRLCSTEDAALACGAERGLLESCCQVGCDDNGW